MKTILGMSKFLSYIGTFIFLYYASICALPVISELSVIGGERGVALVISADSPFEAEFLPAEKKVVAILKRCIYGLSEFKYTDFPSASPLISVSAIEKKNNSVEINFLLKSSVKIPLKTVQKENRWLVLFSDSPTTPFKWSSSEQISYKKESPQEKLSIPSTSDLIEKSSLEDIYFIQRTNICGLSFIFTREIKAELKRVKNSVIIKVNNTESRIDKSVIKIPDQQIFGDIYIKKEEENLILTIPISLDLAQKEQGLFLLNNNVLSLIVKNPYKEKVVIWENKKGIRADYTFVDFPVYSMDLIAMGKRAKRDSNTKISKEKLFEVAMTNNRSSKEKVLKEEASTIISTKAEVEHKNKDTIPSPPKRLMKVIAKSVNVRAKPSVDANVISKLNYGELVDVILEEGKWYKIEKNNQKGYVYSSLLKEESVDTAKEKVIVSTVEEINSIRKVSAITDEPEKIISETTAVVFLRDETDSAKSTVNRVIRYNGRGRDPFVPILPSTLSVDGLPFVDNLILVGILYDDIDRIALCEDQHNNSKPFSLREGDAVVNGKVLKIYKDKVVFLITEYGISRSYTLRLENVLNPKEVSKR
ncbi:MAG: SH3 domain-containing protein [Chitinispirillaceae bacterium]|nr:SH3 domain-containing protein [Chitinispirillaceae bacterium]